MATGSRRENDIAFPRFDDGALVVVMRSALLGGDEPRADLGYAEHKRTIVVPSGPRALMVS